MDHRVDAQHKCKDAAVENGPCPAHRGLVDPAGRKLGSQRRLIPKRRAPCRREDRQGKLRVIKEYKPNEKWRCHVRYVNAGTRHGTNLEQLK